MPDTISGMHKYLHKLYVPKPGGQTFIYPHIRIGHDTVYSDLRDNILPWLSSGEDGMFYNMLQEEDGE